MEHVSISQLKNQLSAYLKKVQVGETVVVTDRNKPVARISRIPDGDDEDSHVARLEAAGVVTRPTRKLTADMVQPVDFGKDVRVLEALLEERAEGR